MPKVLHVVGARPNFMKVAPIMREMSRCGGHFEQVLVHTNQHYDSGMSAVFLEELELPLPDVNLEVGAGSHAQQTARIMVRFEPLLIMYQPDCVIVVGDVNSTLACALVCAKLQVKVAHVEAGLRSRDRTMPEECNRVITDQIADLLFTPSTDAGENLLREGIPAERIHFVGNVMIDSLVQFLPKAMDRWRTGRATFKMNAGQPYVLVTLHRPANVDSPDALAEIMAALAKISRQVPVIFPVHPRTRDRLVAAQRSIPAAEASRVHLVQPLGYLDFLALEMHATLVLTDSGGVQEETTHLGVPCLTIRATTERPVTITHGTNRLVANDRGTLVDAVWETLELERTGSEGRHPPLWDGRAAERIVRIMRQAL